MALEVAVLSLMKEGSGVRDQGSGKKRQPPGDDPPEPRTPNPEPLRITLDVAEQSMQRKAIVYDDTGDEHYDAASALIKSMRGSDPDAAVYWVARMLEAGEDPRFIARRIAILASEDVGNADPRAISVAAAAFDIVEKIGMPEAQITLSQAAIYMATAPKSNASYMAIVAAMKDVREGRTLPVPKHLKDTHYKGSERLGHGSGYKYAHDFAGGFVEQDYLGVDKTYYEPTDRGYEATIAERMRRLRSGAGEGAAADEDGRAGDAGDAAGGEAPGGGDDAAGANGGAADVSE
jgi:putative ATPase